MDENLGKNDPNRAIIEDEKKGVKPGFLGGSGDSASGGKSEDNERVGKAAKRAEKNNAAADGLRDAESDAADEGGLYHPEDSLSGARQNEESASGFYSGDGRVKEDKKNGKKKGFLRRGGPLLAIIFAVFGVGGLMGGAQMFQPFSLIAQFTESFNSMHTSANMRSGTFFRMQMGDRDEVKNPLGKSNILFGEETFKISNRQANKLAAQGIEYDDDYDGNGTRVLKYVDDTGNMKIVAADAETAAKIGNGAVDFRTEYADNVDFFTKYNAGSTTWRGAIANWFGSLTDMFFANNNLTRNMFGDYQKKLAESGGDPKAVVQETLSARTSEIEGGGFSSKEGIDEQEVNEDGLVYDEEGNPVYKNSDARNITPTENDGRYKASSVEVKETDSRTSIKNLDVEAKLNSISGTVQKGANIACTVSNVIGAISLLVTAAEALQIINLTTMYFETVDKVKAGYGDDAPIHTLTNALNEKTVNTNVSLEYNDRFSGNLESSDNITNGGINALTTEEHTTDKTAMQSSGIAALYGGGAVNPNDPSVSSFNFTNNIKRILGGVGVSMAGFETCAIAKMVSNGVSATMDAVEIIGCIVSVIGATVTLGASLLGCGPFVAKQLAGIAISVGIGLVVSAVIATITPIAKSALTRDLITNLGGEDLGNALTSGGNMYLGNTHRANGGSLATKQEYTQFAMTQQQVIAENAKYERETLSPFDLTSKNTFMGTLMTQFMGFLTTNSLMSTITKSSSTISSSLVAMSPTASAYDIAETLPSMEQYEETCPYLASIGAIGDAYCNPYSITDVSTMEMDPADVIDTLDDMGSFLKDETQTVHGSNGEVENVKINGKSDLAKYIQFCDNRESAFGIADSNIVNAVSSWGNVNTESSTFNTVANSAIGAIPVIGDIIDVGSNAQALANIGYVSGESCVAGNNVENADAGEFNNSNSPNWNKAKYYQRFIEDQALAESMGLINESAVTAYLNEYYKENPLDNSYEGILARKSGLTKDTVVAILDLIEYGDYVANYDPSTRYAFGAPSVEVETEMNFDNENVLAGGVVMPEKIWYADVRNRSFAA